MSSLFASRYRLLTLCLFVAIGFGSIAFRLYSLHVLQGDQFIDVASKTRASFNRIPAFRGSIVDARGNFLALTQNRYQIGVDPESIDPATPQHKWDALAKLLNLPTSALREKSKAKTRTNSKGEQRPVRWAKLAESVDAKVHKQINELHIKGVYGTLQMERVYPGGQTAAHVLGFVNKEGTPSMGIEQFMDFYLKGQDGWVESEKDGARKELAHLRKRHVEPVHGHHVELTIDLFIQQIVEQQLREIAETYDPASASIIVSEPSTGFILALANYPTFDLNQFAQADLDVMRNRAICDIFEPGSTFKIVTSAAAFNEGIANTAKVYDCGRSTFEARGRKYQLPKDWKPFGNLTYGEIITKSSNRGIAQVAISLGEHKLYDYALRFGYGSKSGYGPVGEVAGILHPVEKWDGLTITRLPMGHAVAATPLQVNYAMSVIANQGILMKPQLVRRIFDNAGNTLVSFAPQARHKVVSAEAAREMAELLTEVVQGAGTSGKASVKGFLVAGKSGTTQKIIEGRYSQTQHVSSFSGFFPADNPRAVITIVIDNPKLVGTGFGGRVCAPIFHNIAEQLVQYMNLKPVSQDTALLAWTPKR